MVLQRKFGCIYTVILLVWVGLNSVATGVSIPISHGESTFTKPKSNETAGSMINKPTCGALYEDCIANITLKASSAGGSSEIEFETTVLETVKCTELYLQCRKEAMMMSENDLREVEESIFKIKIMAKM